MADSDVLNLQSEVVFSIIDGIADVEANLLALYYKMTNAITAIDYVNSNDAYYTNGEPVPKLGSTWECKGLLSKLFNESYGMTGEVADALEAILGNDRDEVNRILEKHGLKRKVFSDGINLVTDYAFSAISLFAEVADLTKTGDAMGVVSGTYHTISDFANGDIAGGVTAGLTTIAGMLVDGSSTVLSATFDYAEKVSDNIFDDSMDWNRKAQECAGEGLLILGTAVIAVALAPASLSAAGAVAVGCAIYAGINFVGNTIDALWGSGEGDWVETVSDAMIDGVNSAVENVGNFVQDVGDAAKSTWNTVCSWFS